MTATTSTTRTGRGQGIVLALHTMALAAGWLLTAIGAGWKAIGDAGQMGPDVERSISRHTGARI